VLLDPSARPSPLETAVLRTVVYASLFEYPLTLAQVRGTLIGLAADESAILQCYESSGLLRAAIERRDGYFLLRGQVGTIARRRAREASSRALLAAHRRVLRAICALPYTRLVAMSGSAAHFNVDPDGDLDLFIVTRGSRVWSVMLAIVVLTRLLGCRRVVCANYVVADSALAIERADLFSANQILHLRPLSGAALYGEFLAANPFVAAYYPGPRDAGRPLEGFAPGPVGAWIKRAAERVLACGPAQACEAVSRAVYSRYLRSRAARWQSPEQVDLASDQLKLHTRSHRRAILDRFEAHVTRALHDASAALTGSSRAAGR
jgi:hypothetical protein